MGKFLPALSANFRHVYAIDISQSLLDQARDSYTKLSNVTYAKKDLSRPNLKLERVDFALSVNVAIMPSQKIREAIFKTITRGVRKNGHWLLVVPSLESALFADFRLVQWNLKAGLSPAEAVWELEQADNAASQSLRQGLVDIDGVATKHYLKEELTALFKDSFDILAIEKVRYSWKTEFDNPPKWMKEPYPWDWLVLLKKTKS